MSQFESQFEERFYNERREKLRQLEALGQQAYPNSFAFTHTLVPVQEGVPALLPLGLDAAGEPLSAEALEAAAMAAAIAGRIVALRLQGKAGFATLQQGGARVQIYVRRDDVGEPAFELFKLLDLGDHIGVRGTLMRTRTGELTLKAQNLASGPAAGPALIFLAKAMLPLPDKYSGLGDIELRYRRRYLDLFTDTGDAADTAPKSVILSEAQSAQQNAVILSEGAGLHPAPQSKDPDAAGPATAAETLSTTEPTHTRLPAREVFVKRAAVLRAVRKFFDTRGYLEVETPMLHTIAGGAAARTFTTHHNAEDMELTLRIAPELYLKRLVVGGLDRVYEINRNFRNEGVDSTHNPEFTMLEFYQAYANYHDLMDLTEEMVKFVAMEVNGTTKTTFNDVEIDLTEWTKLSMREAIVKFWPTDFGPPPTDIDFDSARRFNFFVENYAIPSEIPSAHLKALNIAMIGAREAIAPGENIGKHIAAIFEAVAEEHLIQPTIIYDFPLAVSPLSKVKPDEPDWVERFEFYIGGFEVGNAFSELNDPDDQRNRFLAQVADKDPESMAAVDEDYVRALGYGLPPTAGEGIGIDRLTMVLTGSRSIRDVILFPLMRPQKPSEPSAE